MFTSFAALPVKAEEAFPFDMLAHAGLVAGPKEPPQVKVMEALSILYVFKEDISNSK